MVLLKSETLPIQHQEDVVRTRQRVRAWTVEMGFSLIDQTKIVTATSELARNTLEHGGGGTMLVELIQENNKKGIRLTFQDQGAGITNIEQAMKDGFTTSNGLGLGLGGAKRLVNEFAITSEPGGGTQVQITKWL